MTNIIVEGALRFFADADDTDLADINSIIPDLQQLVGWATLEWPKINDVIDSFGPANQAHLKRAAPIVLRMINKFIAKQRKLGL